MSLKNLFRIEVFHYTQRGGGLSKLKAFPREKAAARVGLASDG